MNAVAMAMAMAMDKLPEERRADLRRTKIDSVVGIADGPTSAAGFLLRNQLRDALDPENPRAA